MVGALVLIGPTSCSEAEQPTKAQYSSMADGVCKDVRKKLEKHEERFEEEEEEAADGESSVNVERPDRWFRSRIIPEYQRMHDRLRGIPAPDGDSAYLADMYADLQLRIDELKLSPSRGRDLVREDAKLRTRFANYGMDVCGKV